MARATGCCQYGHDTTQPGARYPSGNCKQCVRDRYLRDRDRILATLRCRDWVEEERNQRMDASKGPDAI